MDAMFGAPKNLEDYEAKAQAMTYDGERAMFEAYRRNRFSSTGVIQWMLNNAGLRSSGTFTTTTSTPLVAI